MWNHFSLALVTLMLVLLAVFVWALVVFAGGQSIPLSQVDLPLALRNLFFCTTSFVLLWVAALLPIRRSIVIKLMLGLGFLFIGAWQELLNTLVRNDWLPVRWLDMISLPGGAAVAALGLFELGKAYRLNRLLLGSYRKIEHNLATVDQLTQLYNRRYFFATCPDLMQSAMGHEETPVLINLRIRNLRRVNVDLGFTAGDNLLTQVARQLLRHVRSGDMAARLSGSRLVIFLPNIHPNDARDMAERILAHCEHLVLHDRAGAEIVARGELDYLISNALPDESFEDWITRSKLALEKPRA